MAHRGIAQTHLDRRFVLRNRQNAAWMTIRETSKIWSILTLLSTRWYEFYIGGQKIINAVLWETLGYILASHKRTWGAIWSRIMTKTPRKWRSVRPRKWSILTLLSTRTLEFYIVKRKQLTLPEWNFDGTSWDCANIFRSHFHPEK